MMNNEYRINISISFIFFRFFLINTRVSKVLSFSLVLNLLHRYPEDENARYASTEVAGIVNSI